MKDLMIIENVRCYQDQNGVAQLNLEDVARGLGFIQNKNGIEYIRWETVKGYLKEFSFPTSWENGKMPDFIPENIFYKLCFKAKNEIARIFQDLVTDKILPAIRQTGGYGTNVLIKQLVESQVNTNNLLTGFKSQIDNNFQETNKKLAEHERLLNKRVHIDFEQKKNIQKAVRDRIQKIAEENDIEYRSNCRFLYKRTYANLNDNFNVATYTEIPEVKYEEALEYIKNIQIYVKDLKEEKNKQLQITVNLK